MRAGGGGGRRGDRRRQEGRGQPCTAPTGHTYQSEPRPNVRFWELGSDSHTKPIIHHRARCRGVPTPSRRQQGGSMRPTRRGSGTRWQDKRRGLGLARAHPRPAPRTQTPGQSHTGMANARWVGGVGCSHAHRPNMTHDHTKHLHQHNTHTSSHTNTQEHTIPHNSTGLPLHEGWDVQGRGRGKAPGRGPVGCQGHGQGGGDALVQAVGCRRVLRVQQPLQGHHGAQAEGGCGSRGAHLTSACRKRGSSVGHKGRGRLGGDTREARGARGDKGGGRGEGR